MKKKIILKVLELILGGGITGVGTYVLNEYQNRNQTEAIIRVLEKLSDADLDNVNKYVDKKISERKTLGKN